MKHFLGSICHIVSLLLILATIGFGYVFVIRMQGCPDFSKWNQPHFCTYQTPDVDNTSPNGISDWKTPLTFFVASAVLAFASYKTGSFLKRK